MSSSIKRKFIDIGANLTDSMFQGIYFNKQHHKPDLPEVLKRSPPSENFRIIITGGSLDDCQQALNLAKTNQYLYSTIGVHPTRCLELEQDSDSKIEKLIKLYQDNPKKIVAVGEFGLDYDRLEFCPKDVQLKNFQKQFELVERTNLPLFLHCRNSAEDLLKILQKNYDKFSKTSGVVHSFDGTLKEAQSFIDLGLYIGLNGCSLKTEDNLKVVEKLPIDKLMIETDSPYCEIKSTHASYNFIQTKFDSMKKEKWNENFLIKGRNEPCKIVQILECIAGVKKLDTNLLADQLFENTRKVFFSFEEK